LLAVEPLEDRVLLSLPATIPILAQVPIAAEKTLVGALKVLAAETPTSARHEVHQYLVNEWLSEHSNDRRGMELVDKHEEAPQEWLEHLVHEYARMARTEAETARLLMDESVTAGQESLTALPLESGPGNALQPGSLNGPAAAVAETPAISPHPQVNLEPFSDTAWLPLAAEPYEEFAWEPAISSTEQLDAAPRQLTAAKPRALAPAAVLPLVEGLLSAVPDPRRAVDEFFSRLGEMKTVPVGTWSSLSFGVWLAVAAGAAVETVRRLNAPRDRWRNLSAPAHWLLHRYLCE
jgi:hypothetical protein